MDRRIVAAVFLMMLVAVVPSLLFKAPPRPVVTVADTGAAARPDSSTGGEAAPLRSSIPAPQRPSPATPSVREDTIVVTSGLYRYAFSTRGARLVSAALPTYPSMAKGSLGAPAELVRPGSDLLGLTLVAGHDTVPISSWNFTPSTRSVAVAAGTGAPLVFTGSQGGVTVRLTYTFRPADYRFDVAGAIEGLGSTGGFLLVNLGDGIENTEADTLDNGRSSALVVKPLGKSTDVIPFYKVTPGSSRAEPGPFSWAASKSKYFVVGLFAPDTTARWTAAEATVPPGVGKYSGVAALQLSQPVAAAGSFRFQVYAGPMEYGRLSAIGDDFDDINPYGWPGVRTVIRPFALLFRSVFVWMHTHLGITYGWAIILLGVLIRVVLWPLNQKAMRSAMAMQAIQPHMKALQERHKDDPARLQREMMLLYKEHGANPLGGCLPMLIPMPILFALFFVFQSTIELRGVSFWWFTDLSQPDPHYIIPVVTGLSMLALSWIGQRGMPPNPQTKMMMWMAPIMYTFFGLRFAAGLNLYYVVSNLASLPQQWLISEERRRRKPPTPVELAKRK